MRSLRVVGAVFLAGVTIAAQTASARAQGLRSEATVDACGPWSTTPRPADCETTESARAGAQLLLELGGLFGIRSHAQGASAWSTNLGIEYFSGGSSLDLFGSALGSGRDQPGEVWEEDLFAAMLTGTLLQGLFLAAPHRWQWPPLGSYVFVEAVTPNSPAFGIRPLHRFDDGGGDVYTAHSPQPQSPVSSTPEPGSMALIATGLAGLGAARARKRRRA
jgi:hypothetical protein